MNRKITLAKVKAKRFTKKARAALSRRFDCTLSLNLKGEIPREVVAVLALLGFATAVWALVKLVRRCF